MESNRKCTRICLLGPLAGSSISGWRDSHQRLCHATLRESVITVEGLKASLPSFANWSISLYPFPGGAYIALHCPTTLLSPSGWRSNPRMPIGLLICPLSSVEPLESPRMPPAPALVELLLDPSLERSLRWDELDPQTHQQPLKWTDDLNQIPGRNSLPIRPKTVEDSIRLRIQYNLFGGLAAA